MRNLHWLFLGLCLAIMPSLAIANEEVAHEPNLQAIPEDQFDVQQARLDAACRKLYNKVTNYMYAEKECWQDSDCLGVHFGCPWQEPGCNYAIMTQDDPKELEDMTKNMAFYQMQCVLPHIEKVEQCKAQDRRYLNMKCPTPKLQCMNGRCVTSSHVFFQEQ